MHISRTLRFALGVTVALFAVTSSSFAGPNTPGTLIVHNVGIEYCADDGSMCDIYNADPVAACESVDSSEDHSIAPHLWAVLAAFPEELSPRVAGIVFGVDYDDVEMTVVADESCGDFQLSTQNWPASSSGTAITWEVAQTDHLIPVAMFAGYHYYESTGSFDLVATVARVSSPLLPTTPFRPISTRLSRWEA